MIEPTQRIDNFWIEFQDLKDALAEISTADHPAYDAVLWHLQQIDSRLYFEFSTSAEICELIITAEGNAELFDLVEQTVARAPELNACRVFALKPKLGFPISTTWEGLVVKMSDVVFDPQSRKGSSDLGLRIFVAGLAPDDVDRAHAAILRAIDHGLGERSFAEKVQFLEVLPLPAGTPPDDYIPLTDLEKYIDWRSRNQVPGREGPVEEDPR
jgi:hypothetical protein